MNNRLKSNDDTLTYYSLIVGDDTLKTNRLKTAYADSFAYDGDGAATFVGGDAYEYNWKNRVEHIDVNDGYIDHDFFYDYDYQGLRVRKEEKTVDEVFGLRGKPVIDIRYNYTYYFYDASGRLLCEYDEGNLKRKFVYLPSAIIQISGNDTSYLHLDNLGSPAVVTDESGDVIKSYRYYAFGELRSQSGAFSTDYSFTGYLKEETGSHYAKMRYYEGGIGRFMRVDPLGALNPYVYCNNDPLNFVDPWGLTQQPLSWSPAEGYALGHYVVTVYKDERNSGGGWAYDYIDSYDDAFIYVIERSRHDVPHGGGDRYHRGGGRGGSGRGGGGGGVPYWRPRSKSVIKKAIEGIENYAESFFSLEGGYFNANITVIGKYFVGGSFGVLRDSSGRISFEFGPVSGLPGGAFSISRSIDPITSGVQAVSQINIGILTFQAGRHIGSGVKCMEFGGGVPPGFSAWGGVYFVTHPR